MQICFSTHNAAFSNYDCAPGVRESEARNREVVRILRDLARKVELGLERGTLYDIEGHTIGEWSL